MGNKVKIDLLGAGRIGKLHGENLAHAVPNADLYAVADPCGTHPACGKSASHDRETVAGELRLFA